MSEEEKYYWTYAATKRLIKMYYANELLHKVDHPDYSNREKRKSVQEKIANAFVDPRQRQCTQEDIRKKLNMLRTQFSTQRAKVLKSIAEGANASNVYKPSVYWYPMLQFLDDSSEADNPISNIYDSDEDVKSYYFEPSPLPSSKRKSRPPLPGSVVKERMDDEHPYAYTRLSITTPTDSFPETPEEDIETFKESDEFVIFAKFVASELRSMKGRGSDLVYRQTKRKIQKVLLDAWQEIDGGGGT